MGEVAVDDDVIIRLQATSLGLFSYGLRSPYDV